MTGVEAEPRLKGPAKIGTPPLSGLIRPFTDRALQSGHASRVLDSGAAVYEPAQSLIPPQTRDQVGGFDLRAEPRISVLSQQLAREEWLAASLRGLFYVPEFSFGDLLHSPGPQPQRGLPDLQYEVF